MNLKSSFLKKYRVIPIMPRVEINIVIKNAKIKINWLSQTGGEFLPLSLIICNSSDLFGPYKTFKTPIKCNLINDILLFVNISIALSKLYLL